MAKKGSPTRPGQTRPGPTRPDSPPTASGGAGFSLGGAGGFSLGAGALSLDAATHGGPIRAPMPDPAGRPAGEGLAIEREDAQELAEYQAMTRDPKLSAAEFYEKKAKEKARLARVQDVGYYIGLVFATNDDLHAFLDQLPKPPEIFDGWIDGYEFAAALGYDVPRTNLTDPSGNVLEQWAELALTVEPPPEPVLGDDFDPFFE